MTSRVASTASPSHRSAAHRQLHGIRSFRSSFGRWRESSIWAASRCSGGSATSNRRDRWPSWRSTCGTSAVSCQAGSGSIRKAGALRGCARPLPSGRRWPCSGGATISSWRGRFARALAAELTAVGISLDYAPVLDIHTNPKNPVIGDRALGEKPDTVAKLGRVIIEELQRAGVAACGKHFPGHGDTATDSHVELPLVEHPPDRLRAVEFVPFKAAIEAGVAFIMTAHVLVHLDRRRAAGDAVAQDREEISSRRARVHGRHRVRRPGNEGDRQHLRAGEAAVAAIAAGCDAVLMCGAGSRARHRAAGGGARGARSCRRGRAALGQAGRGGPRAKSSREGAVPARVAPADARSVEDRDRLRQTPRDFRADGVVRLILHAEATEAALGRQSGGHRACQPVHSRRVRQGHSGAAASRLRAGVRRQRVCQQGGYLSGEGSVRAKAFLEAWRDPSIRALIAVRGGYGSVHLLPYLEKHDLRDLAEGVHRLQRSHDRPLVSDDGLRNRVVSRTDARQAAWARHRGVRSRHVRARADEHGAARRARSAGAGNVLQR